MREFTTHDPFGLTDLIYDNALPLSKLMDAVPSSVNTSGRLTESISLRIPLLSAVMDMVTGVCMAIATARRGGTGISRRNPSTGEQAARVHQVKRSESSMAEDPITVDPDVTVDEPDSLCGHHRISGLPVVNEDGALLDVITNRDPCFVPQDKQTTLYMCDCVTSRDQLVVGQIGISRERARHLLTEHHVEKLPVTDDNDHLTGLITVEDSIRTEQYPNTTKDSCGRLVAGATVDYQGGTQERVTALAEAGVGVLVVDTVNGGTQSALDIIRRIKAGLTSRSINIIGSNVITTEDIQVLIDVGVDAVKVSVGPDSTRTIRVVVSVDVSQITAIHLVAKVYGPTRAPPITDGDLQYSDSIGEALAAGTDTIMLGSLLADCEESPGRVVFISGKQFKYYHDVGSLGTMSSHGRRSYSENRYFQVNIASNDKIVPEGIEGRVPCTSSLAQVIYQLVGDLHQTIFYLGTSTVSQVKANDHFIRITGADLRESHPHDMQMTTEVLNHRSPSTR